MFEKKFVYFILVIVTIIAIPYYVVIMDILNTKKEYTYSGKFVSKGTDDLNDRYRTDVDPKYFIMFREKKTLKIIRVNVTVPEWNDADSGKIIEYRISNRDLKLYGNTRDNTKNLYGE